MNWIADRLFGPFIDNLIAWSPYIWLFLVAGFALALAWGWPVLFKKFWQPLLFAAATGFILLWVWQHYDNIAKLEEKNATLEADLATAQETATNLQDSIDAQGKAIADIEQNQRRIRSDINAARRGLDSRTIRQETENDPTQAAIDLSTRWNNLGRMFDDETNSFGTATPSRASPGPDAAAAGDVGNSRDWATGE